MSNVFEYSPTEQLVLDLLKANDAGLDIHQLVKRVYKNKDKPFTAQIVVRSAVMSLIEKTLLNREPFTVQRTKQGGRKPALFRIVRQKGLKSARK